MRIKDFDPLFPLAAVDPPEPLPEGFASLVLLRARQMRDLTRRHWRVLLVASLCSTGLAVAIAVSLARETGRTVPPMQEFATRSAPFAPSPKPSPRSLPEAAR